MHLPNFRMSQYYNPSHHSPTAVSLGNENGYWTLTISFRYRIRNCHYFLIVDISGNVHNNGVCNAHLYEYIQN